MEKVYEISDDTLYACFAIRWWEFATEREIVKFQLFASRLCCPIDVYHNALEKTLGRPVWTHELAFSEDALRAEFCGEKPAPTFEEIIDLLPKGNLVVVCVG